MRFAGIVLEQTGGIDPTPALSSEQGRVEMTIGQPPPDGGSPLSRLSLFGSDFTAAKGTKQPRDSYRDSGMDNVSKRSVNMKRTKRPRIWSATATGPSIRHTLTASARWRSVIIRLLSLWSVSRQRVISIMTAASLFWPASICLGVIVAQAQELPRNDLKTGAAPTIEQQPSQNIAALHLSLLTANPIALKDLTAPGSSWHQLTDQRPTGAPSRTVETALAATDAAGFRARPSKLHASLTEESIADARGNGFIRNSASAALSANSRGTEFSSLAALASTPSPSLLRAIQRKYAYMSAGRTDTKLPSNDSSAVVYQLGRVNLVINHLPDSFSLGDSMPGSR
jgi:hypothetical protein